MLLQSQKHGTRLNLNLYTQNINGIQCEGCLITRSDARPGKVMKKFESNLWVWSGVALALFVLLGLWDPYGGRTKELEPRPLARFILEISGRERSSEYPYFWLACFLPLSIALAWPIHAIIMVAVRALRGVQPRGAR